MGGVSDDGPVNQFGIPFAAVPGQSETVVLDVSEFEAWAALRAEKCGHRNGLPISCRWCSGTRLVAETIHYGATKIHLYPARL